MSEDGGQWSERMVYPGDEPQEAQDAHGMVTPERNRPSDISYGLCRLCLLWLK
jgi:hypothetical protein